jgi:hypothetical protein
VLLDLAAKHFEVAADRLTAREGTIEVSGVPDRSVTYGELVDGRRLDFEIGASGEQFDMKVAPRAHAKDPHGYTVVGRSVPRKDIPAKVTGTFIYRSGRARPRHAARSCRTPVWSWRALARRGRVRFVKHSRLRPHGSSGRFSRVVATTEWAAIQAAQKLGSTLQPSGPDATQAKWSDWNDLPEMDQIWETVRQASGRDIVVAKHGSVDAALERAARTPHEEVTFDRAHVTSRDWEGYPILRFAEIPDSIEVVIVNN